MNEKIVYNLINKLEAVSPYLGRLTKGVIRMNRYNIYANNMLSNRAFNVGITIDKSEEWVKAEVERLNSFINPNVIYFYEEV